MASPQQRSFQALRDCRSSHPQRAAQPSTAISYIVTAGGIIQPASINKNSSSASQLLSRLAAGETASETSIQNPLIKKANTANRSSQQLRIAPPSHEPQPEPRHSPSNTDVCDPSDVTSKAPDLGKIDPRCESASPPLSPLRIPKARPRLPVDLLPESLPIPDLMFHTSCDPSTMVCPECATPASLAEADQTTTICQSCLKEFKASEKRSQRRGNVLTSFPPLLTNFIPLREETQGQWNSAEDDQATREMGIVESIGRAFGWLRGGSGGTSQTGSRRGSESSLESWYEKLGGRSSPASSGSVTLSSTS